MLWLQISLNNAAKHSNLPEVMRAMVLMANAAYMQNPTKVYINSVVVCKTFTF